MYFKILIICLTIASLNNGETIEPSLDSNADPLVNNGMLEMLKMKLPGMLKSIRSGTMLGLVYKGYQHENVSSECQLALGNLSAGLDENNNNAIIFVDATAKLQSGIGLGSRTMLGSFDQCLEADYPSKKNSAFHGKYCSIRFQISQQFAAMLFNLESLKSIGAGGASIRMDICIPSLCTKDDINVALANAVKSDRAVSVDVCQTRDKVGFKTNQIVAIIILSILAAFLVIGTVLDVTMRLISAFCENPPDVLHDGKGLLLRRILLCFSMYTNGVNLLKTDEAAGTLSAVNGIRFLSMAWVVLGHSFAFTIMTVYGNFTQILKLAENFAYQAIINFTVAVDSFFFLSGLLVAYVTINAWRKNGGVNWGLYYFHRVWRLTPAYGLVMLVSLIYPLFGSGPIWNNYVDTNCEKNWWVTLLYISNIYRNEAMCLGQGWYLSNDMQFYVLSPIIIIAFYKKPIAGIMVNLAFMLVAIITPICLGVQYETSLAALYFGLAKDPMKNDKLFRAVYMTPWCRMGPYCVGLYAGFFLAGNRKLSFSRMTKTVLWCLAIACNMSVLYGAFEWFKGNPSSIAVHNFYLGTHRTAWAAGLAWVVIACTTGNGGVVNSILSWKLFVPLSKITYMSYLTHGFMISAYGSIIRERLMYVNYSFVVTYLGFQVISLGVAFVATLAFEVPFLGLEKIFFPKRVKKEPDAYVPASQNEML